LDSLHIPTVELKPPPQTDRERTAEALSVINDYLATVKDDELEHAQDTINRVAAILAKQER
jgi:hypothetical protein